MATKRSKRVTSKTSLTHVPKKKRRAIVRAQMDAFLEQFREHGIRSTAARSLALDPCQVDKWRKRDEEFDAQYRAAEKEAMERMRYISWKRSTIGWDEPLTFQGSVQMKANPAFISKEETPDEPERIPETVRKFDNKLLVKELEARAPEVYKKRVDVTSGGEAVKTYVNMPIDEM